MEAEQWAWIWENLRNYSESSSGITEGQSGVQDALHKIPNLQKNPDDLFEEGWEEVPS